MEAAGNLVRVLVELAAGMQHAHHDLGRRAFRLMLVVELYSGRDAASVVRNRDRAVGVDGDYDIVAMTGQGLVDRVVDHFEHHVMKPGAVRGVADVHPRTLAHRFKAFKLLDARFIVSGRGVAFSHGVLPGQMRIGMTTYLNVSLPGRTNKALEFASAR